MKFYDLEFIDYQNLPDSQINKAIYEILEFDEVEFVFCWIEFLSVSHNKGTKQYSVRIHDLSKDTDG